MSDFFWLSDAQMARLEPFLPKSHGKPRVDDRRVLRGIIFINRNGLRWRDAPAAYGLHKTLYNRWKCWSDKGIFARMMKGLAAEHGEEQTVMIDATYLKAHRTATSMAAKKGGRSPDWSHQGWYEHQTTCHLRQPRATAEPICHRRTGKRLHQTAGIAEQLADVDWLLGDRVDDADWLREALKDKGIRACIPGRKQRKKPVKDYKRRNRIEIMFGRLKDWPRVATRYDRCPKVLLSAIALAAIVIYWL